MTYRQLATDCAIAIMLAVPTIPLAKPSLEAPATATADRATADRAAVAAASLAGSREARRG